MIHLEENPAVTNAIENLLQQMTLAEKIGQMTQVEKNSLSPEDVTTHFIGSVLSGGGGNPADNNPQAWADMVRAFSEAALKTRLAIPLIYGVDAVHGHNNVKGAVIFPHNIGLGATRDADLVERIAEVTAQELLATHVHWTFAPAVTVPQDIRWGRVYEGYSENTDVVIPLSLAYARGLNKNQKVLHSFKHFVGDGATEWNSTQPASWSAANNWQSATSFYKIDQGDARIDEATLRHTHLRPYHEAIKAGALNIMVSFSSWNGLKMHAQKYLLTDVLKGELGFKGFVVSDWMALDQLNADYYTCVVQAINAGLDMVMTPFKYRLFIDTLHEAVTKGDVSQDRIDDAVRRILLAKFEIGLFKQPFGNETLLADFGAVAHRAVAREAVRKSLVLLKNEAQTLPLSKDLSDILLVGNGANDVGIQCGGWTIDWQGKAGEVVGGTSILEALRQTVSPRTTIHYAADGNFDDSVRADIGIAVFGEHPYAEGFGDTNRVTLAEENIEVLHKLRARCKRVVVLLISGRPLIVTEQLPLMDAFVATWLFGTEAQGITDVLFGDYPFTGRLSFSWLRDETQLPLAALKASSNAPLWQFGEGLS